MGTIEKFIQDQLSVWPLAAANFRSLKTARTKEIMIRDTAVKVQFNPCRIASSTADIDPKVIAARPCFLCVEHRQKEQFHIRFEGRKGRRYNVQVNPFPIFPGHLVICRDTHTPQSIWHNFVDMMDFCRKYPQYLVFYNGPFSGASAPDHMHFQACHTGDLPLQNAVDAFLVNAGTPLASVQDAKLYQLPGYGRGVYALKADTPKSLAKLFYWLADCADIRPGEPEPRLNLFTYIHGKEYRAFVTLRGNLRSHHYTAEGPEHLTMSPGAADMAGMFVAPCEEDFEKVDERMLTDMLDEVCISKEEEKMIAWRLTRKQPTIDVGIMSAEEITFEMISDGAGPQTVRFKDGRIEYNGALYDELFFDSITRSTVFAEPSFILYGVTIGIDFHWQRRQTQQFAGSLKFIVMDGKVVAINRVGLENYLLSVISSEMKSTATLEFLKAHAVISRSWVLTNLKRTHTAFDVCADDHCQRYQGLTVAAGDKVRAAIDQTWGQVLRSGGEICDTRFSKCCGGRSELFSTCWEDVDYPYLQPVDDPFCDTDDQEVLSQVLNDYDLETKDFHDWTVRYGSKELSELVKRRTGMDFGEITALEPLERGVSGRIKYLRIVGTTRTETIGKELAIRRALSESHLKSSAFTVERDGDDFVLTGKGWGHGVGLCQIGAAVMASKGYGYKEILQYYYPGAEIS